MQDYQREFLHFVLETDVLRFGEFKLKSGRISPYFFNAGLFNTGASLARLGRFYAQAIIDHGLEFDLIYGPAYKGIPLAALTSAALYDHHGIDVPYAFNRKEIKDHGEGGMIIGHPLEGDVLIIDDVISAGTSVRESVDIIKAQDAKASSVIIALDRQERGKTSVSAVQEVERDYNLQVSAIVCLEHLIDYVNEHDEYLQWQKAIESYRNHYGAAYAPS